MTIKPDGANTQHASVADPDASDFIDTHGIIADPIFHVPRRVPARLPNGSRHGWEVHGVIARENQHACIVRKHRGSGRFFTVAWAGYESGPYDWAEACRVYASRQPRGAEWEATLTDTFGGEPNFGWARRARFRVPTSASTATVVRAAKRALGVSYRHLWVRDHGDAHLTLEFPARTCVVAFIHQL